MLYTFLSKQIRAQLTFTPTDEQTQVMDALAVFLLSTQSDILFLLKGYAGTGKTSLVGALVRVLDQLQQKVVLLAPTGRAAKVFSSYAGHQAYTIHKKIYRQRSFSNSLDNFSLNDNLHQHTLFIVDEASMIANAGGGVNGFGSGCLLDDLVQYVYSGQGCRLLLVGDTAQLPPVGEDESPALSVSMLESYGLNVSEHVLTQVARQNSSSGILWHATRIRQVIDEGSFSRLPKIRVSDYADIHCVAGNELIDSLSESYGKAGIDETMVICRSNKRAHQYNMGIRNMILGREEELESGDRLLVAKNNYFWTEGNRDVPFIANGDIAVVRRVRRVRELYGFRFADVRVVFPDYDDWELEASILLDTLHTDVPALSRADSDRLFNAVLEDYADIPHKAERMKRMKTDPHYNALQVKYAYAVTCHKAQGGQWQHIYLDQAYMPESMLSMDCLRWLYTAFTRATRQLFLVNYPVTEVE